MAKKILGTSKKRPARQAHIEAVRGPVFDLATLIAGITDEDRHGEVGCGSTVGSEVLSSAQYKGAYKKGANLR